MHFSVITLFPDLIEAVVAHGLIGQAREKNLVQIDTLNPREFTSDPHRTVDDRAFGGGDGMVMKVDPLARAVESLPSGTRIVVLSPQGSLWDQQMARAWANEGRATALVCGRYAGIDHRFTAQYADEEISLGDFILNGGEIAACAVIESVARLLPGVLGNQQSAQQDSFSDGLLECPQFTRPREIADWPVPAPLLSGHHARIREFELAVSRVRTAVLRPDLHSVLPEDLRKALVVLNGLSDGELRSLGLTRADLEGLDP